MDISQGDLEIEESLTIRGAGTGGQTSVRWRNGALADKVFELLGDCNQDGEADYGSVSSANYTIWAATQGSTTDLRADGNDDGTVNQSD